MKDTPVRYIKGVGPKKEAGFNDLGVYTVGDLLYYFPFRYEDRRLLKKIKELSGDQAALVKGEVVACNLKNMSYFRRAKKVKSIFEIGLADNSGRINCVWFNQGYLSDKIKVGDKIVVYGKPRVSDGRLKLISPEYEYFGNESLNLDRIVGIYSLSSVFNQKFMRKILSVAFRHYKDGIFESLPFYIRQQKSFPNIVKSLNSIHFPDCWQAAEKAREKFIFEELFFSQILVYLRKSKRQFRKGIVLKSNNEFINKLKNNLVFELTSSQKEAVSKILGDLAKSYPMHRLLQGDVGCGKTVVSAFAAGICVDCGYQAAVMVPTEILAYQHKETLDRMFKETRFRVEVVTSSLPRAKIKKIHNDLETGKINIIIGTHALIQEEVKFKKIGLVIIDEQHKFGVAQRALLPKKTETNPHCLVMSATPIPRSLALSLYGDLDLTVIKDMPQGRKIPNNIWVKENKRQWVYSFLRDKLKEKRQIYVVYPVIEENQDQDLKSLEVMYKDLSKKFSPYSVGMFHGRMKPLEKLEVIDKFKKNDIHILLSTTVVEVGVNIENATVMLVENPERFGLAQLHQLRGRIQRSNHQPHFILISKNDLSDVASRRLDVISSVTDGFKIAEEDLIIRGPGDFFGHIQHGIPKLRIASPLRDLEVLKEARLFAYNVIKNDPYLEKPQHKCIREHLGFWFQKTED
ncbi:MAG: ATP-dependent DNA helicase RecG [Candidatus Omnitrophota bacterium]|nr:ATP-dependent DNA helicase RecG [Candidatus Omnitrophota bacterium]